MGIYFCDVFGVAEATLEDYGAFNVSLTTDLPLFVDPFLLFNSENQTYQNLHAEIVKYLRFLREKSVNSQIDKGLIDAWYCFPEVHENWFGFSETNNKGRGLGRDFANSLNRNLGALFKDFGQEQITRGSHLEKLCLVKDGVGRDNISDFTTNLIKGYLLNYTQQFALQNISTEKLKEFTVQRVRFNYSTESWERGKFTLPCFNHNFVLLTPKDILTRDSTWINKDDLYRQFDEIPEAIPNAELRSQINNYFYRILPKDAQKKERNEAILNVIQEFPEFLDYYVKFKEAHGDDAESISAEKVLHTEELFIAGAKELRQKLQSHTKFYDLEDGSYTAALERVKYLKQVIEKNDGYKLFWTKDTPIKREADLQLLYKLTWFGSAFDVNREVNNGRGPVDYKVSNGKKDAALVEFKLAKNTALKKNLQNQVEIYEEANQTKKSLKVIMYFSLEEYQRVLSILKELKLEGKEDIVLIDARSDNKPSASTASELGKPSLDPITSL